MARTLFDSPYIFGSHEPGGEIPMLAARKPGWVLFTEALGSNPDDHGSRDYREFSNQDLGVICRLNNGYHPAGTIPYSSRYEDFARRCANFVAGSQGCKIWIIGNEMNYRIERPQDQAVAVAFSALFSSDDGEPNRRDDAERFAALHDKPAPPTPPPHLISLPRLWPLFVRRWAVKSSRLTSTHVAIHFVVTRSIALKAMQTIRF